MSENCAKVIRIITLPQVLVFFLILLLGDQIPPWHHEMAIVLLCVVPLISYLYWHISPELREQGRKSQRKLAIIFSVTGYILGTIYCIAFGGSKTELFMYGEPLEGYIDIGLIDTMGDMMIETAGAAAYAVVFALDKGRHPAFIHAAMASLPEKKSVHAQAE